MDANVPRIIKIDVLTVLMSEFVSRMEPKWLLTKFGLEKKRTVYAPGM